MKTFFALPRRFLDWLFDVLKLDIDDRLLAFIMIMPSALLIFLFAIYPAIQGLWTSFYVVEAATYETSFTGLDNYLALFESDLFWESLRRTLVLVGTSVSLQLLLGLGISLLVHQELLGRNIARGLVLFPYLVPAIVIALTWRFSLDPTLGVINKTLVDWDIIERPIPFFARANSAMPMVIFAGIWKYTPFFVILLLARLQIIPKEVEEAARLDGASNWQLFRYITLPWLMPVIVVGLLLRTIWSFNEFEMVYLFASGGPLFSTTSLPVLVRYLAFDAQLIGQAAATATIMVLILLVLSWGYFKLYDYSTQELE